MKISTGSPAFDELLEGGFETGIVNTVYGPAGSGKSNLCLLTCANFDGKIVYIDTEGSFSLERFKQVCPDYEKVLERIIFFRPTNFEEQKDFFEKIKDLDSKIGLIVFDSVAMLYRLEMGKNKDVYNVNRDLGIQISYLSEIARKKDICVLVTNQVYSSFENKDQINMVGGDILKYSSKCLIELQKNQDKRWAILRKHRSIPDGNGFEFKIINEGIERISPHKNN